MPPRKSASTSTADSAPAPKRAASTKRKAKKEDSPAVAEPDPVPETGEDKREVESASDSDEGAPPAKKKKKQAGPKAKKPPVEPLDPALPTNTAFPDPLEPFARPKEGCVRIASWNVAGLRAAEKKGFSKYVEAEDADVLVVTETKCESLALPALDDRYPHRFWGLHPQKGQAGTAIFSKLEPLNVVKGMPTTEPDVPQSESEGRIITLEFEHTFVVGTYVPNAGAGLKTLPQKAEWNKAFEVYLRELDAKKPVIWVGDLNVIPTEKDIRNWKTNHNKSAGVTDTEIEGFRAQLNPDEASGHQRLVDVWRERNPDLEGHYSYFSYKFQCRSKGIGWRLDFVVASERILDKVQECEIRHSVYGASDHLPIVVDIEGPL